MAGQGIGVEGAVLNVVAGIVLADDFASTLANNVDDAVGPAAQKAGKTFGDKISESFETIGKRASVAITAPLVALGTKGVFDAQKVTAGLAEVVSLSGRTGEEAANQISVLRDEVGALASEFGIAQSVLVSGLYQAISAGVPEGDVFSFLAIAGQAAIAGVTDTETAVDGLTTVINAFGLDSKDAQAVADSLFTAVKGGKTTFEELSAALFQVAPAAAAAGVDFQTVNAAIATLTAAGVPTSVATTQIRAAIVALQRPSEELDSIFQALGFSTRASAIESLGLQGALGAVADAAAGDNGKLQQLLGSVEAVGAANIITSTGAEKFRAELEAQANAAGSTQAAFELIDQTRGFDRLKVQLENISVSLGTILLPIVSKAVEFFGDLAAKFQNLDPSTRQLIVVIGGIAAAVGPVLIVIAKIITAVKTISTVISSLSLLLTANPWILVAAAAVAAVVLIIKNWENIVAFFAGIWEFISAGFNQVREVIVNAFTGVVDRIEAALSGIRNVVQNVIDAVVKLFTSVVDRVRGAWDRIVEIVSNVFNRVKDTVSKVLETIAKVITNYVTNVYVKPFNLFVDAIGKIWGGISALATKVFTGIGAVIQRAVKLYIGYANLVLRAFTLVWSGITKGASIAFNFIIGLFKKISDAVGKILGAFKGIIGIAGRIPGLGDLFRADGGPVSGNQPYIVGERGPEVFVPRTSGTIIPNNKLGSLGGGQSYVINVYNPVAETTSTSIPEALRRAAYLRG